MPTHVGVGIGFYAFYALNLAVSEILVTCNPNISERASGEFPIGLFVHFSVTLIAESIDVEAFFCVGIAQRYTHIAMKSCVEFIAGGVTFGHIIDRSENFCDAFGHVSNPSIVNSLAVVSR